MPCSGGLIKFKFSIYVINIADLRGIFFIGINNIIVIGSGFIYLSFIVPGYSHKDDNNNNPCIFNN